MSLTTKNIIITLCDNYTLNDYAGKQLVIVYPAKVTDKAGMNATGNNNEAKLQYSKDSNLESGDYPNPPTAKTYNYTFDLSTNVSGSETDSILNKVGQETATSTTSKPLAGAVFTLYTARYLSNFQECLLVLMQKLAEDDTDGVLWRRWAFIPRVSRTRCADKSQYFGIESAQIEFLIGTTSRTLPLPTTEADFKDLPILSSFLCMKLLRKQYLSGLDTVERLSEYPAWDCVTAIYRNILLYKICYYCVWVGVCFVLQSILFTFFYSDFYACL